MNKKWELQRQRITDLSRNLRLQYYSAHSEDNCIFSTPHGINGNMTESIGSWPEFILRGTFCCRTFRGLCSPCFYSQFPANRKATGEAYIQMIQSQYDYVVDNFEKLVINRQYGNTDPGVVRFVLTPTGSFFDESEFPQTHRIDMLKKLADTAEKYEVTVFLHVECHCKDWNALNRQTKDSVIELELLRKLNAKILFGFESADEYVRNVLYNKDLGMTEFLEAYHGVLEERLNVGAFIFAGLFSMNDALTRDDVCSSIDFAIQLGITPVLMFQNVQKNSITDLLYRANEISLIEPFTVMEIILHLIQSIEKATGSDWLIADPKGGPPVPEFNIFDCAKVTSKENAETIYSMICALRTSRDVNAFAKQAKKLKESENYDDYCRYLASCECRDKLERRTDSLISCAEKIYAQNYGGN